MYWGCVLRPTARVSEIASDRSSSQSPVLVGRGTWTLESGDRLWIQGSNGQGKTTLLQPMLGLKHPVPSFWERILSQKGKGELFQGGGSWVSSTEERGWFFRGWLGSDALGFDTWDVQDLKQAEAHTPSLCPPFLRLDEGLSSSSHSSQQPHVSSFQPSRLMSEGFSEGCTTQGVGLSTGQRRKVCLWRQMRLRRWLMVWDEGLNGLDWRSRRACLHWMRHHFLAEGGSWVFVDHLAAQPTPPSHSLYR